MLKDLHELNLSAQQLREVLQRSKAFVKVQGGCLSPSTLWGDYELSTQSPGEQSQERL